MHDPSFFTDRSDLSKLAEPTGTLIEAMKRQGLIAPDHKRVRFCGIFSWDKGTAIFLPANSNLNQSPMLSSHWLFHTLNRYYKDKDTGIGGTEGDSLIGGGLLSIVLSLFEDYEQYGLYIRRSRLHTVNQGKTNWSKTISRHTPFPSDSAPLYLELESSRTRYVSDCETARIHAAVIREIKKQFGVLLHGKTVLVDSSLEKMPLPSGDNDGQISYLNRELYLSYSERDINLIKLLKRYLERAQGSDTNSLIIGTRHFQNVWERMLDDALSGENSFNRQLPVPYYLTNDHYHEVANKGQRTDTILRNDDGRRYAVVDAKYYRASTPQNAPGWPDLVKQFFYQKAVVESVREVGVVVTTHFIFPGKNKILKSAHVGPRGQHYKTELQHTNGYPVIHCHYCEPEVLMETYVNRGQLNQLREEIFQSV